MDTEQAGRPKWSHRLKQWAGVVRRDVHALYLASRDPRVPWYAKALAIFIAGYALSPIDLIPDFIPLVGYVDDAAVIAACLAMVREDLARFKARHP